MKQVFIFIFSALTLVCNAQYVGIGTTTPDFPLTVSGNSSGTLSVWGAALKATNNYTGTLFSSGIHGISIGASPSGSPTTGTTGIYGELTSTAGGYYSAAVRGVNRATDGSGIGVIGYHAGGGWGMYAESQSGYGIYSYSASGTAGYFQSPGNTAVYATSNIGGATVATINAFNGYNGSLASSALYGYTNGSGNTGSTTTGTSGVFGELTATSGGYFSAGVRGISRSTNGYGMGVIGYQAGSGFGLYGETPSGTGVVGVSTSGSGGTFSSNTGTALNAVSSGAVPVFQASNSNANNTGIIYASGNPTVGGTTFAGASAVVGELTATSGGTYSAALRGINRSTTNFGMGVIGYQAGSGFGVYGECPTGFAVVGTTSLGTAGSFSSGSGTGVAASSTGTAATVFASNSNSSSIAGTIYGSSASTAASGVATSGGSGVVGEIISTSGGYLSAGVRGINRSTAVGAMGVVGYTAGGGSGVYGQGVSGEGVLGNSVSGPGGSFTSSTGNGLTAYSGGNVPTFTSTNVSTGNTSGSIYGSSASTAASGAATSGGSGVVGEITSTSAGYFSAGVRGINRSTSANGMGLVGFHAGAGMGVYGESSSGSGINGYSSTGYGGNFTSNSGTGMLANAQSSGNPAIFQGGGVNVARIDRTGKGFFNNGTQNSGADVAEAFSVEGNRADYEPGDVLVISTNSDRTVAKSQTSYSTLVVGVYATKPGVLLTERMENETQEDLVPLGVVGVIPTKVCSENGPIHRGDMLVTSSSPGRAMKATKEQIVFGSVIGKALEDFTTEGNGIIKVLVNVK